MHTSQSSKFRERVFLLLNWIIWNCKNFDHIVCQMRGGETNYELWLIKMDNLQHLCLKIIHLSTISSEFTNLFAQNFTIGNLVHGSISSLWNSAHSTQPHKLQGTNWENFTQHNWAWVTRFSMCGQGSKNHHLCYWNCSMF